KERWYSINPRRFFSISGDVRRPGVYELPVKVTLRTLVEGKYGALGMAEGMKLKAIATSGPSGGFLPARIEGDALRNLRESATVTLATLRDSRPSDAKKVERFLTEKLTPVVQSLDVLD